MKLIKIIRHPLRVEYRLTVITAKETTNTYGTNRRLLSKMARRLTASCYWSLYKKGPFGLPERLIDYGEIIRVQ